MLNRRKHIRRDIALGATAVCRITGVSFPCSIIDISQGGARFAFGALDTIPSHFTVVMPGGIMRCCSVVRRRGPYVSARFVAADVAPALANMAAARPKD